MDHHLDIYMSFPATLRNLIILNLRVFGGVGGRKLWEMWIFFRKCEIFLKVEDAVQILSHIFMYCHLTTKIRMLEPEMRTVSVKFFINISLTFSYYKEENQFLMLEETCW